MAHWKLTLMYDGSSFHGWQVQPGLDTVQATLAAALLRLTGETVLPQGSGRTDAGVHALGQVCSFHLDSPVPATNLQRALNRVLPTTVRVVGTEQVPAGFHARHSARRKTYEYHLFERRLRDGAGQVRERICSPFLAPFVWDVRWPLALKAMQQAARILCGKHDFTSFAATDPDRNTRDLAAGARRELRGSEKHRNEEHESEEHETEVHETGIQSSDGIGKAVPVASAVRTIFHSAWQRREDLLIYRVTGNGFLHHMVRNLVGTLVDVGRGHLAPADLRSILTARDRGAAGPTAPARGLFLVAVEYEATCEDASL